MIDPKLITQSQKIPLLILLIIISIRLIMIFMPLNYDYPDQYWQGPQVAYSIYNKNFKNIQTGYQTWQWTMNNPIRNPVYQYYLVLGYVIVQKLFSIIHGVKLYLPQIVFNILTYHNLMEFSPKIMQSFIAILGDVYLVKLFYIYFDKSQITIYSVLFILTNWFYLTMMSRTYINSLQCALMCISYYYYQKHLLLKQARSRFLSPQFITYNDFVSRFIILISYVSRPTSLIPWMIIWPAQLINTAKELFTVTKDYRQNALKEIEYIILRNLAQIIIMVMFSCFVGSFYFSKFLLTEWNFLYYNLVLKWAQTFDTHPFYFYYIISVPVIMGLSVVFIISGITCCLIPKNQIDLNNTQLLHYNKPSLQKPINKLTYFMLLISILLTLISSHKQHRFLMILMPFAMIVCFRGYLKIRNHVFYSNKKSIFKIPFYYLFIVLLLLFNVFLGFSIAFIPKGGISTLKYMRNDMDLLVSNTQISYEDIGVMYLSDANALPAYSIILRPILLQIPDDTPQKKLSNLSEINYLKQHPLSLYNIMKKRLQEKSKRTQKLSIQYLIVQMKYYSQLQIYYPQIQPLTIQQIKFNSLQKQWQQVIKDYQLVQVQQNCNFWEHVILGYDQLYLYRLKNRSQQLFQQY